MSQYPPSPYSTPQPIPQGYSYDPYGNYLAPARRASVLMIVIGVLLAGYSMCNGTSVMLLPAEQLQAQSQMFSGGGPTMDVETLRVMTVIVSALGLIIGLAHITLAVPIRRGGGGAILSGIVLTSVLLMLSALGMLMCVLAGLMVPLAFLGVCILAIPVSLLVLQLFWLIQARKSSGLAAAMHAQYQQQYWQYQQQQQMYGYGYAQQQPQQPGPQPYSPPQPYAAPQAPPQPPGGSANDTTTSG